MKQYLMIVFLLLAILYFQSKNICPRLSGIIALALIAEVSCLLWVASGGAAVFLSAVFTVLPCLPGVVV